MTGPEVVGHGARTVDEKGSIGRSQAGHTWHDTAMERVYTTPRIDKLGVRPGARVAVVGIPDQDIRAELAARTHDVTVGEPLPETDIVLLAADSQEELAALPELRAALVPNGAIWVVSRKGRDATLRDVDVTSAARASGLVDNKVSSFSPTHTALRLVIPVALRGTVGSAE